MEDPRWETQDIEFDSDGRLIIKNAQLAELLRAEIQERGKVLIDLNNFCPPPGDPRPSPDKMCMCVAVGPHLSFRPERPSE